MSRQGLIVENNESIAVLFNTRFDICATYPEYLIVPKALTGEQLIACSKFRTKNRLQAMTYFHKATDCSIWRSSQPMNAMMNYQSPEDQAMIDAIARMGTSIAPTDFGKATENAEK